jgi:hypothetical protein
MMSKRTAVQCSVTVKTREQIPSFFALPQDVQNIVTHGSVYMGARWRLGIRSGCSICNEFVRLVQAGTVVPGVHFDKDGRGPIRG